MHKEVNAKSFDNNINGNSSQKTFKISVSGSPNSCLVKIGKQRYRTLVDTGAECSLMHRRIYDQLKNKPSLINKKVCLQSANGTELKCDGCITVQICIGGTEMSQDFYVIRDLNRNMILGLDWLKQNNVRIYFDLKCLRINGKHYVNLEEDIHIASTVRMKKTCLIKPQTAMICYGKVRENPDLPVGQSYEITQIDKGFLVNQFNVMPFGLSNAPAVFQELMSVVLQGCNDFATAYLDDIMVFSSTLEEHLEHLSIIFGKLRQHNLKLKLKKCSFLQLETNYLGFVIGEEGIKPDEKKIEAIKSLPVPTCVREVRSFIGMCSYYRRLIPNFSQIAEPIIALTRKYAHFKWSDTHQRAFEYLKDSLTAVPLLVYPDSSKPYVLYTDSSDTCIGACLTQECDGDEKPIYYLSHKLSRSQCKWSVVEKEAFAIHFALQKLDYYLHNSQFVIRTDHKPMKYLLESPMQNKKIQLWALSMSGYNCTIEYFAGTTNTCADLLSRHPDNVRKTSDDQDCEEVEDQTVLDVNDNLYEINILDSTQFEPKSFASCDLPNDESFEKCDCSDFRKGGFEM